MAKSACKCKETECEECPEWIFTFADLVMLMMGFFVILWVLKPNTTPDKKPDGQVLPPELIAKIREAFGNLPDPSNSDPIDDFWKLMHKIDEVAPLKGPGKGGETQLPRHGVVGTDPETKSVRPGQQAIVGARLMFTAGSVELSHETITELDDIAKIIIGHRQIVLVKGHTSLDDFAETSDSKSRMDISVRRAQAVADYLVAHGVSPDMLRVQGCSIFEPVVERAYKPDERALNRRVEIEATTTLIPERQDSSKTTTSFIPTEPSVGEDVHKAAPPKAPAHASTGHE